MAIGSLGKVGRLDQLRAFAAVQVRSGYRSATEVRADIYDAVLDEVAVPAEAQRRTDDYLASAREELARDALGWPAHTEFDRLQEAFADLEAADIVVLQACDDHWAANEVLQARAAGGRPPRGIAYFTHTDVWHAVEHHMLEINVWHGSAANITDDDPLLADVVAVFASHQLEAHFDEGRIEVAVSWQRRP